MGELTLMYASGPLLVLYDDRGTLIGTILRPLARDPLGAGRETVYLARAAEPSERPAAVAA